MGTGSELAAATRRSELRAAGAEWRRRRQEAGLFKREVVATMRAAGFDWHLSTVSRTESGARELRSVEVAALESILSSPRRQRPHVSTDAKLELTDTQRAAQGAQLRTRRQAAGLSAYRVASEMVEAGFVQWYPATVARTENGTRALWANELAALDAILDAEAVR